MSYTAPVNELRFGIRVHGRLDEILQLPHAEGLDAEMVDAVLDEAARFASEQWADTNRTGDLHGAGFSDDLITTHPDVARAYHDFCEAGWAGLRAPAEFGGQGLPRGVARRGGGVMPLMRAAMASASTPVSLTKRTASSTLVSIWSWESLPAAPTPSSSTSAPWWTAPPCFRAASLRSWPAALPW